MGQTCRHGSSCRRRGEKPRREKARRFSSERPADGITGTVERRCTAPFFCDRLREIFHEVSFCRCFRRLIIGGYVASRRENLLTLWMPSFQFCSSC